jgi:hypothetical protein
MKTGLQISAEINIWIFIQPECVNGTPLYGAEPYALPFVSMAAETYICTLFLLPG